MYSSTINIEKGYYEKVEFSIDGLPQDTSVDYDPSNIITINQDGKLVITLNIDENADTKTYPLTINAISTTQNKTDGLLLEVTSDDVDNDGVKNDVDIEDNLLSTCKKLSYSIIIFYVDYHSPPPFASPSPLPLPGFMSPRAYY